MTSGLSRLKGSGLRRMLLYQNGTRVSVYGDLSAEVNREDERSHRLSLSVL